MGRQTDRRKRIAAAATSGVLAVGVLAGCGGTTDDAGSAGEKSSSSTARAEDGDDGAGGKAGGDGAGAVAAAYQKTAEAGTAKMSLVTEAEAGEQEVTMRGSGVIDLDKGNSEMTMDVGGSELEQRVVDGVVYQKPPAGQQDQLPEGKTWMSFDLERMGDQLGVDTQVSDPAAAFSYAKGISEKDVKKVGEETVDGTETTHYEVTVDVKTLAQGNEKMAKMLEERVGKTLPLDIWLDDEGRLRQQKMEIEVDTSNTGASQAPEEITVDTTLKFSDFGTDVDVKKPAAGDTADMTDKAAREGKKNS
ncbi:LppX_LprAFG lipoprotein [Streptomyces zingiberis]|uniref:LppX_LprAFG lipoprotein n=1 Tax=Streptomyces zingiberis TaxID=2053010 RepID=A0ABX1BW48_9ACTN|nr:LppX_LprAFG lipoprotein [Streptomyces zingiberis]NJP99498.1 LppX_LprAFG lipoprotein [Streptomyces zingiberis]